MAVEDHVRRGHPILFGLIFLFSIIAVAISTWLVNTYNSKNNYPSAAIRDRTRFLLFTSWWTFLFSAAYLVLFQIASGSFVTSIASHLTWISITWIFWTAGAASITAALGGGLNCDTFSGAHCGQLNALEGFAWVEWILFTVALFSVIFLAARSVRKGDRVSGQLV